MCSSIFCAEKGLPGIGWLHRRWTPGREIVGIARHVHISARIQNQRSWSIGLGGGGCYKDVVGSRGI